MLNSAAKILIALFKECAYHKIQQYSDQNYFYNCKCIFSAHICPLCSSSKQWKMFLCLFMYVIRLLSQLETISLIHLLVSNFLFFFIYINTYLISIWIQQVFWTKKLLSQVSQKVWEVLKVIEQCRVLSTAAVIDGHFKIQPLVTSLIHLSKVSDTYS